jgi:hypothetical protein
VHNDAAKIALLGMCRNVKRIEMSAAAEATASGYFGEHDDGPGELCR